MEKETIELTILHNPKITDKDNGFAINLIINGEDTQITEINVDTLLHIASILTNCDNHILNLISNILYGGANKN